MERFCVRCGSQGPFRSEGALRCLDCDAKRVEDRREYHRLYHKARGRAIELLIQKHPKEFQRLMAEERVKVQDEEDMGNAEESKAG